VGLPRGLSTTNDIGAATRNVKSELGTVFPSVDRDHSIFNLNLHKTVLNHYEIIRYLLVQEYV
jgi:hypothetical protein